MILRFLRDLGFLSGALLASLVAVSFTTTYFGGGSFIVAISLLGVQAIAVGLPAVLSYFVLGFFLSDEVKMRIYGLPLIGGLLALFNALFYLNYFHGDYLELIPYITIGLMAGLFHSLFISLFAYIKISQKGQNNVHG